MLLSLFYGMASCVVLYRCKNMIQNFFLQKMSLFFPILIASNAMSLFYSPSFSSFSSHCHILYFWHTVEHFSVMITNHLCLLTSVYLNLEAITNYQSNKNAPKTKEDATKLMIERKKLTKLYNLKIFKSRNKHNE